MSIVEGGGDFAENRRGLISDFLSMEPVSPVTEVSRVARYAPVVVAWELACLTGISANRLKLVSSPWRRS